MCNVTTTGVVTAIAFNGYYVQDPDGDGNPNTADGMFVFQFGGIPNVGDTVTLTDTVTENVPGGCATGNLSTTQMSFPTVVTRVRSTRSRLRSIIGTSGRIPPAVDVISEDEEPTNMQPSSCPGGGGRRRSTPPTTASTSTRAWKGMLVTVENPVAVSATRTFNSFSSELFTLPNNGANIAPPNARNAGAASIFRLAHQHRRPEPRAGADPVRPTISGGATVPAITVGDQLASVTGVMGYSFGNFEVNATGQVTFAPGGLGTRQHRWSRSRRK